MALKNRLNFAKVRTVLVGLLLLGFASSASAVTSTFKILMDLDNHQNTGCDVTTLTGTFQGVERILIITVDTGSSSGNVSAVQYQSCTTPPNTFSLPIAVGAPPGHPLPWPVGVGNGTGGTSVIESYIPLSLAPSGSPPIIRLGVLAFDNSGILRDELLKTMPTPGNGPPILLQAGTILEVPTLSELGLLLLALLLAVAAVAVLRRRTATAFLGALLLLGMAAVAWAAVTCDLNGNTLTEWTASSSLAVDANPDTPPAPAGADMRAFFGFKDVTLQALSFRIDALLLYNTPPTAANDSAAVTEDSVANPINVLANDTDPDPGDTFTVGSVTQPANGTVAITNSGADLVYTPNPDYCNNPPGTAFDTFTYSLNPGGSTATVTVTVSCADDPPVAVADAAVVSEGSVANAINVLANDTDVDGGPKNIASATSPANGTVALTPAGPGPYTGLTYTPNANYCNSVSGIPDTFNYTLTPGSSSTTVSVTVTCVDDPPVAVADSATVNEDSGANAINVLANDTDIDGGPKNIASVTQPANGVVVITGGGTGLTYQPNPNYCNTPPGTTLDTFTYTLTPAGPTPTATVTMTVTCVDDAPVAVNDAATVVEDSGATAINVLANDTDVDGGPKSIGSVTQPANGSVVITGGGTGLTYQPNPNYCNTPPGTTLDTFTYTLTPAGPTPTATVTMTVTCVDDPPTAVNDAATVAEDSGATAINVLANDTDIDGGPKSIASVTQPANGSVVITGGGTGLTYQPNPNYCNTPPGTTLDTFTYTLTPAGPTPTATVTMTVTCVDDAPVAVNDAATVVEDSGATAINVLANDTDIDGGPKSIGSVTQPANGSVVITGGGTGLTYQPNPNYCNTPPGTALDTFTYTLTPAGPTPTATVTVTVTCVDDAPVAVNDAATVSEDDPATAINVLANDTDVDGGPKSIASVTQPANGSVVITGGGTGLTYQPNANYCNNPPGTTPDTFTYTLTPAGPTPTATVSMTVTCVDDAPVAVNDSATVAEDDPATAIPVLANDTDIDGGPKTIGSVTQPANGSVVITGGGTGLTYQPNANYCEIKVSTAAQYRLGENDSGAIAGNTGNNPTTALVGGPNLPRIGSPVYTSTVPAAVTSSLAMSFNGTSDAYAASTLASTAVNNFGIEAWVRSNGSVTGNAVIAYNGSTTASGWGLYRIGGNYGFSYGGVVTTGLAPVVPGVWTHLALVRQSGTTTFYVNGYAVTTSAAVPNTPATASSGGMMIGGNLAGTQFFDGAIDEVRIFTFTAGQFSPSDLTLSGSPTRTSPDTFTYTLAQGGPTPTATVSVTATCVDDPSAAVDDAATVTQSAPATAVDVLINDTDVDGGPRSIGSVTQPVNGTVVITGGGTGLTYQPNAGYCNTPPGTSPDTFTYTLAQGGPTPTATVSMNVICDTPPTAVNDAATVVEDSGATAINVLANDTDPDGGPKSITSVTQPTNGVVVITGGGTGLTYQPNADYCNTPIPPGTVDTFTYTLTPAGPTPTATVSMTVTCVDDPPTAVNDAATVAEDSGATAVTVLANDTDIDGGPKSIASVTQPANGVVVITGGGTGLTYAPNANYCNTPIPPGTVDTFTYTLTPAGPTPTATVSMTVTCVDDAPVAVNDAATVTEDAPATPISVLANDTDVDGGPKGIASVTQPANGSVVITGGGTGLTYQPNPNYCNTPIPPGTVDTFTYTLTPAGPTPTATVSMTVTCVNDPPTDIVLSKSDVDENQPINTVVGTFSTTDPDVGDPHTYTLVGGAGSTDNGSFNISGSQLRTSAVFNFEVKSSYSIRVRTTDSGALFFEKIFTITVNDLPEAPVANNNTYDTIGNTELRVDRPAGTTPNVPVTSPASPPNLGVLDNDTDDDTGQTNTLKVSAIVGCADTSAPFGDGPACSTVNGGTVLMQDDGSFSYFPKAGDTAASDSFQYTVKDTTSLTAIGTVTINRKERVWYVKNNTPTAGVAGTSVDPFNTLAAAQTASSANDYIFVYFGDGTSTGQTAGIILKAGQHLIGEHAGLDVPITGTFNGASNPTIHLVDAASGNRPLIDRSGAGNHTVSATNAIPVEIVGLSLQSTNANAIDLTNGGALPSNATLSILNNVIRSAGGKGISTALNAGTTGTLTLNITGNSWNTAGTHTGNAVDINRAAGTLNLNFSSNTNIVSAATAVNIVGGAAANMFITNFAGNTVHQNTAGSGIVISNATFDQTPGGSFQTVSGGFTQVGTPGNGVGLSGIQMTGVSGDLSFSDLLVVADGGAGLSVTGSGTFTGSAGFQIAVSNGGANRIVTATGGPAVSATSATISLPFQTITSTNSASTGAAFNSVTGAFSDSSGSSISGSNGTGFQVGSSNATISYAGTINTTTGKGVDLTSNTGSTVSFTGALTLSSGSNTAFNASGGGTVTATNTSSTLISTTGTALNVASTTIGAGGLKFQSITAGTAGSGPTNGIVLNSTGTTGTLTVSGTGSAASGGTIQKTGAEGILITGPANASFSWMSIQNPGTHGISSTTANNLTVANSTCTDALGNSSSDDCLHTSNTTGTLTITNCTMNGARHQGITIDNFNTNMAALNMTGTTVTNTPGGDGMLMQMRGTSVLATGTISGNTFSNNSATGLQVNNADTGNIQSLTVQSNTVTSNNAGMDFDLSQASSMTVVVQSNTITNSHSQALNLVTATSATGGSMTATLRTNNIGTAGVNDSGSAIGNGIRVANGGLNISLTIDGNVIREVPNGRGIDIEAQAYSSNLNLKAKIINNQIVRPSGTNQNIGCGANVPCPSASIFVLSDSNNLGGFDHVCTVITGNTAYDPTSWPAGGEGAFYFARRTSASNTLSLEGTQANVTSQIQGTNTITNLTAAGVVDENTSGTVTIVPAGTCGGFPP